MILSHTCRLALLLACAGAAVSAVGCQPAPTDVSGTIKLKGQAPNIKGLEICFLGADGRPIAAPIAANGSYTATGVPVGDVQIWFVFAPNQGAANSGRSPLSRPPVKEGPPPSGSNANDAKNPIPRPLRDGSTSNLSFKVERKKKKKKKEIKNKKDKK